ncbi:sensor histidine kinase [Catenuloplanes japonicus]|uniref:sensor histidine kinase n=1 Tax=Catenuloplanes japonicus TaxID=33876 RepID=UPI00068B7F8D|nr:histidine kinase [Catenuloplanes japonicus]
MTPKRTDWLLPPAFAAVQLGVWPGPALFRQPPAVVAVALAVTAVVALALGFRRVRPVTTLAVVWAAVMAGQLGGSPVDLLTAAPLVALFSVAAWTGVRTTLAATVLLTVATGIGNAFTPGYYQGESGIGVVLLVAADTLGTALVALFGHRRQVWRRGRARARQRLAEAEAARARAALHERHRLARELHDVSAHHLTAIVVTVTAATRLAATRPELAADALGFSAQAARRTLDTLFDLVAVMRGADATGDLPTRVAGLAAESGRLGQPVTVDCGTLGDVPGPVAEAAFAIVREALTNTVRYAPGGPVTIRVCAVAGAVEVSVANGPATRASDADGVGSGSGLAGARARAEQLGGTLTAGPAPDGGWLVTARLPPAAPAARLKRAWQVRPASVRGYVTDSLIALLLAIGSIGVLLVEPTHGPGALLATGGVLTLHAVPLIWAHRAPWAVLAATLTVLLGWAGLCVAGLLPAGLLLALMVAGLAEIYAVYAIAAHGRGLPALTWLAAPGTAAVIGLTVGLGGAPEVAAADPTGGPGGDGRAELVLAGAFVAVLAGVLVVGPLVAAWVFGASWRRRRTRLQDRERDVVAAAAASADGEALAERWRIAAELRATVLARAHEVLAAAGPGAAGSEAAAMSERSFAGRPPVGAARSAEEPTGGAPSLSAASGTDRMRADAGAPEVRSTDTAARLDAVLVAARATLAAMRELLGSLRGGASADDPETSPQPTAAQIGALCEAQRAAGRPVMLRYATPVPALPPGVDVSAYRLVEAALALPGGPLEIVVGVSGGLRILLNRIPALTDPRTAAGLRGRVDAVSGAMTVHPAGETEIWLPLTAAHQEVPSSPSV